MCWGWWLILCPPSSAFFEYRRGCLIRAVRSLLPELTYPRWYTRLPLIHLLCGSSQEFNWYCHYIQGINLVALCYSYCDISRIKRIFWIDYITNYAAKSLELQWYTSNSLSRRFWVWFRTGAHSIAVMWMNLLMHGILKTLRKAHPVHILWELFLFQSYATKSILGENVGGVYQPIFRKWFWLYVEGMSMIYSKTINSSFVALWIISLYIFVVVARFHLYHILG